jgi:hypothetical protein
LGILLGGLSLVAGIARAHPVAQGAMEVKASESWIEIEAHVSNEEAFVAESFSRSGDGAAKNLEGLWQRHGPYVLDHLKLWVNGTRIEGRVTAMQPPPTPLPEARITYTLRYEILSSVSHPRVLELRQDILNEFQFAPGNPWEATYLVRVTEEGRLTQEGRLFTRTEPLRIELGRSVSPGTAPPVLDHWGMALAFAHHGMAHVLGGLDHLLFIAALILAVKSFWDLVKVVTAFSVAHTITLTLAVLNLVRVPSRIVEPMIALSIVSVALQNVIFPESSRSAPRLVVAFGFGLFHGLGFAGGLLRSMEGMPGVSVFIAIAAFSVGVEIGHQIVALPLFGAMQALRREERQRYPDARKARGAVQFGSCAIGLAGGFYLVSALLQS